MSNRLVKIFTSHYGEVYDDPKWCLVVHDTGSMAFCSGEFFGFGESRCEYKEKTTQRGGITCPRCLYKIKMIKSVKL